MNISQAWGGRKCKHIVFTEQPHRHHEPFGFTQKTSESSSFMESADIRVRTVMNGFICLYNEKQAEYWVPLDNIVSIEYDSTEIKRRRLQMRFNKSIMRIV